MTTKPEGWYLAMEHSTYPLGHTGYVGPFPTEAEAVRYREFAGPIGSIPRPSFELEFNNAYVMTPGEALDTSYQRW